MDALLRHPEARREIERRLEELRTGKVEERQLGGIVGSLGSLLGGTLGAVLDNVLGLIPTAAAVKGLQRFPEGKLEYLKNHQAITTDSGAQRTILSRHLDRQTNVDLALA